MKHLLLFLISLIAAPAAAQPYPVKPIEMISPTGAGGGSDLVARMGYKDQGYRDLFSAPYHLGKTAADNVAEYRRRSPAWNAEKLQTPLLIHTATNDEDVNVLEVEHLIKSLKAAGKSFEHKIYSNAPGAHAFNRLDTKLAQDSRQEIYRFFAKHLKPANPVK